MDYKDTKDHLRFLFLFLFFSPVRLDLQAKCWNLKTLRKWNVRVAVAEEDVAEEVDEVVLVVVEEDGALSWASHLVVVIVIISPQMLQTGW